MEEGAEKWALRDLRREEETSEEKGEYGQHLNISLTHPKSIHSPTMPSSPALPRKWPFERESRDTGNKGAFQTIRTGVVLHFWRGVLEDGGHDEGYFGTAFDNLVPTVNFG